MKKSIQFHSPNSNWIHQMADNENKTVSEKAITVLPAHIGQGKAYFTQIIPGLFGLYIDFTLVSALKIDHKISEKDFYVLHFDFGEKKTSLIEINDAEYQKVISFGSGLTIFTSSVQSSFNPSIGASTSVLRLLADKAIFNDYINDSRIEHLVIQEMAAKKIHYYHDSIDSNSMLLLDSLRKRANSETAFFDSFLKGVSLKLLGSFLDRYSHNKNKGIEISDKGLQAIIRTNEYLLKNLQNPFPSINFLAKMARMSPSRYIFLFKLKYSLTPSSYFSNEKILLAKKLLKSGKYNSLTEVIYELNYNRLDYFSARYHAIFKRRPSEDFIKNKENQQ